MRLSQEQKQSIVGNFINIFTNCNTTLWLFGSRVDDAQRGGDIDLLIEYSALKNINQLEIQYEIQLQREIGPRKIDIILYDIMQPQRQIIKEAKNTGIILWQIKQEVRMAKYSDLERLNNIWHVIKFHLECIDNALNSLNEIGLNVINEDKLISLSAMERGLIDTLMYRFVLIQDTIGERILPLIAEIRLGDKKAMIWLDVLSQLEKLHVLSSENDWQELRKMRNLITHEYDIEPLNRLNTITLLFDKINLLKQQLKLIDECVMQLNQSKTE